MPLADNYKLLSGLLTLTVIALALLYVTKPSVTDETALLYSHPLTWYINLYDRDEMIFEFWINNFGYFEAKSINVTCELYAADDEGYPLDEIADFSVTQKVSNLASTTHRLETIAGPGANEIDMGTFYWSLCKIESCDGCEILRDRIEE